MLALTLPDGSVRSFPGPVTGTELAESISKSLAKKAIATTIDVHSASASPGRLSGLAQASSENSAHTKLNLPTGSLNEKTIITTIGTIR